MCLGLAIFFLLICIVSCFSICCQFITIRLQLLIFLVSTLVFFYFFIFFCFSFLLALLSDSNILLNFHLEMKDKMKSFRIIQKERFLNEVKNERKKQALLNLQHDFFFLSPQKGHFFLQQQINSNKFCFVIILVVVFHNVFYQLHFRLQLVVLYLL